MADEFSKTKAPVAVLEYEPSAFETALIKHKSKLILVAVLGVAGSLGYWGYKLYTDASNKSANVAGYRADTPEALKSVASEHSGKAAAGTALVRAAQKLNADNKSTEAAALLKQFLADYPDHGLRDQAELLNAEILAASGDAAGAAQAYESLSKKDTAGAGFALLRLGDIEWAAGNTAKATEYYDRLTSSAAFTGTYPRERAMQRKNLHLKTKPPELVEFVPEAPPVPQAAPSYVENPEVSPGDGFLPPPLTKLQPAAPPSPQLAPAPVIPESAPAPSGENPAPLTPGADNTLESPATPEKPAASEGAPDKAGEKSSDSSKGKLDGGENSATGNATPQ